MLPETALELGRQAILLVLLLSAPLLMVGLAVGVVVGILQTVTNIQEQTLAFVPKILAVMTACLLLLPWLLARMSDYTHELFVSLSQNL